MNKKRINVNRMKESVKPPLFNTGKEEEAWCHYDITNCYSYALGMFEDIDHLRPGEISDMEYKPMYTDEEIFERVIRDLEMLGLECTVSCLEEKIEDEYSWKIAVMNVDPETAPYYDYHFLKQGLNQKWFHKLSYEQFPSQYDSRYRVIENPETASYSYRYHLVGYIVVRQVQAEKRAS